MARWRRLIKITINPNDHHQPLARKKLHIHLSNRDFISVPQNINI